jgi:hypothetical protein
MMQPHFRRRVSPRLALQPPAPGSPSPRLRPHLNLTSLAPRLELTQEPSPAVERRYFLAALERRSPLRKFRSPR